jgi:hypothetical protein
VHLSIVRLRSACAQAAEVNRGAMFDPDKAVSAAQAPPWQARPPDLVDERPSALSYFCMDGGPPPLFIASPCTALLPSRVHGSSPVSTAIPHAGSRQSKEAAEAKMGRRGRAGDALPKGGKLQQSLFRDSTPHQVWLSVSGRPTRSTALDARPCSAAPGGAAEGAGATNPREELLVGRGGGAALRSDAHQGADAVHRPLFYRYCGVNRYGCVIDTVV